MAVGAKPEKGIRSSGSGVAGRCKMPDIGSRN